jgi:colicin import membrane protein
MTHTDVPAPDTGSDLLPNLSGDIEEILGRGPSFRGALRGYDRVQVDNYVSWVEAELRTGRREISDLVERYGECSTELELSRRLLAGSPEGQELVRVSERIGSMLRLAADEAADLTAAGRAEAERLVTDARTEAEATRQKAAEVQRLAVENGNRVRAEAAQVRGEASAALADARTEADRVRQESLAERDRLDREALQARERAAAEQEQQLAEAALALVQEQIAELGRRREQARGTLGRLDEMVAQAMALVDDLGKVVGGGPGSRAAV